MSRFDGEQRMKTTSSAPRFLGWLFQDGLQGEIHCSSPSVARKADVLSTVLLFLGEKGKMERNPGLAEMETLDISF